MLHRRKVSERNVSIPNITHYAQLSVSEITSPEDSGDAEEHSEPEATLGANTKWALGLFCALQ